MGIILNAWLESFVEIACVNIAKLKFPCKQIEIRKHISVYTLSYVHESCTGSYYCKIGTDGMSQLPSNLIPKPFQNSQREH